jgi:N-glycosylase/DNA lyase
MAPTLLQEFLPARDYNLTATLTSGQAFRWSWHRDAWEGVIGQRWVRLRQEDEGIRAETVEASLRVGLASAQPFNWDWLVHYLQTGINLSSILRTFPDDEPMRTATRACRGLRLLRQDPWECLASFILSSTKQIVQIQQIVGALCLRFGTPVPVPANREPLWSFPTAERLAQTTESELRACKMGFRAPNLLAAAKMVAGGELDLIALQRATTAEARQQLLRLRGVGEKISNCVLLFAYGFQDAFPVDVWVTKALRQLYFPKRRPAQSRIERFIATHFGPHSGYAQQYLFHYMRTAQGRERTGTRPSRHGQLLKVSICKITAEKRK